MERIIGLALTRYLTHYIKNFSSSNFKNWTLTDLEFKEDVVQALVGIPPNFKIKKVTCNQVYTKIPWSRLGHDPIVFVADTIYLDLEEPFDIVADTKLVKKPAEPPAKKQQGFTQRILDNIKFEIKELKLRIQFLGKEFRLGLTKDLPPIIHVAVKDIVVHSTNSKWEVVDLQEVYKMSQNDEVLIYKEVHVGSFTMELEPKIGGKLVSVIDSLPIRVRTKVKKAYFGGPTMFFQVEFAIVNGLELSMHHLMFKQLQDVVDAVMECLYRPASAPAAAVVKPAAEADVPPALSSAPSSSSSEASTSVDSPSSSSTETSSAPQSRGLWGRMSNILGSYSYWGAKQQPEQSTQPAASQDSAQTNVSTDSASPTEEPSKTDDDGYGTPEEEEEFVPDEKGTVVPDEEDITYSSYQVVIPNGSINLFEYVLESTKGIANFKFSNLDLEFIPRIQRTIEGEAIFRAEAHIKIDNYSLTALQPGAERHPDYLKFVQFIEDPPVGSSSTDVGNSAPKQPMFTLDFFKIADEPNKKPAPNSKQLFVFFRNVKIVFDLVIWESIYMFFFGGAKGRRFEQYMGQNLEYMLEAALSDTMKFEITTANPTIVLPPFAGKFPGKPHLASKVMTVHTSVLRFRSAPRDEQPSAVFRDGLPGLPPTRFPRRLEDLMNDEKSFSTQRFALDIDDLCVDIQATPAELPQRVLQPIKLSSQIARHEFMNEPKSSAQIETFTVIDDIDFSISQSQYQYLFEVYGERLSWNPHRMTEEKKEIFIMEKMLEAAQKGLSTSEAVQVEMPDDGPSLLVSTAVHIGKCSVRLREKVKPPTSNLGHRRRTSQFDPSFLRDDSLASSSSSSSHSPHSSSSNLLRSGAFASDGWDTFAEIKFDTLQYHGESRPDKLVTKVSASRFMVSTPPHMQSPFPNLVVPLDNIKNKKSHSLLVRVESYRSPNPAATKPPTMTWIELNGVQICWIYFTIAKVQLFFTGNEEAAEFDADAVRQFMSKYKFSEQQTASMNWTLNMSASELLVVETAETPECSPMELVEGTMSRTGVGPEEIHYEFDGQVSFFTKLWEAQRQQFDKESLTLAFPMKVLYIYRRNAASNTWCTDMSLDIKDLDVSLSRQQLILMQNILDNQMSDIRDVSTLRSQQQQEQQNKSQQKSNQLAPVSLSASSQDAKPFEKVKHLNLPAAAVAASSNLRILQSSFTINVRKMKLNLRQGKDVFAQINMRDFVYATESWTHLWTMLIEADHFAVISTQDQSERPHFATIIQPRSDFSSSAMYGSPSSTGSVSSSSPRSGRKRERSNSGRISTPGRVRSGSAAEQALVSFSTSQAKNKHRARRTSNAMPSPSASSSQSSSSSNSAAGVGLNSSSNASEVGPKLIRLRLDRKIVQQAPPQESTIRKSASDSDFSLHSSSSSSSRSRKQKQPANDDDTMPWSSRWLIDVAPLQIVYSPATYQKLQDFFALLEEHKNLRRRYQQIQTEFSKIYREQEWFASTSPRDLSASVNLKSSDSSDSDAPITPEDTGIIFTISISKPLILLPDVISEKITSLIEVHADGLSISNDREDNADFVGKDLQRIDIVMLQMMMNLKTLETKHEVLNVIQTQEIIHPVTLRLLIQSKRRGANGIPYMHVQCDLDLFAAVISLKKYQTMVSIANSYLSKLFSSFSKSGAEHPATNMQSSQSSTDSPASGSPLVMSSDSITLPVIVPDQEALAVEQKPTPVERVFELTIKNLNLSVISDYLAELDLFYIHITNLDVFVSMLPSRTEFKANLRLEALVNDLNFMIPEKFIDQFYLTVSFKTGEDPEAVDRKRMREAAAKSQLGLLEEVDGPSTSVELDADGDEDDDDNENASASLEVAVLDRFQVYLTKDILRHLMEIYNLYRAEGEKAETSSDMHSHFQYILVNNTEADILFGQERTNEIKSIEAGKDSTFAFSNPYLPKHLEIQLDGWAKADTIVDVEEPGASLLRMQNTYNVGQLRDLIVTVVPRELKRYVEFQATFYVTNETDRPLHIITSRYGRSVGLTNPTKQYVLLPGKRTPISWSRNWDMEFAARFDDNWSYSETFRVPRARLLSSVAASETIKLNLERPDTFEEAVLLATFTFQETEFEGVVIVNLALSAPLIVENMTAFPLWYEFPLLNAVRPATIPPVSSSFFFFDLEKFSNVNLKLDGYDVWGKPVSLSKKRIVSVENKKSSLLAGEGEKSAVDLDVEVAERLVTRKARSVFVTTQFLLINDTDFLLFVKQRTSKSGYVTIPPRRMIPFSWASIGRRKLSVGVGTTAWSSPIDPKEDAVHQLTMEPDGLNRSYKLVMDVRSISESSRVIVWRSWLNFRNQTNRHIFVCMNYLETEAQNPVDQSGAEMGTIRRLDLLKRQLSLQPASDSYRSWLKLPTMSAIKSAVCPTTIGVSVSQDSSEWTLLPLPIDKSGTYTLKLENKQEPGAFVALDVSVQDDEKGLYVTLKENADPPYIIYNNTPFPVRIRRMEPERVEVLPEDLEDLERGGGLLDDSGERPKPRLSYTALLDHLGALGSDVYTIEPHGKLNYYSMGLQKEEESELKFQMSVFLPEEERLSSTSPSKHASSLTSNRGSPVHGSQTADSERGSKARRKLFEQDDDLQTANDLSDSDSDQEPLIDLDDDLSVSSIKIAVNGEQVSSTAESSFKPGHGRHKSTGGVVIGKQKEKDSTDSSSTSSKYGTPMGTPASSMRSSRNTMSASSTSESSESAATRPPSQGRMGHRRTPSEPVVVGSSGAVFDHLKPTKRAMKFRQFFSENRAPWSEGFSVDRSGEHIVRFRRMDGFDPLANRSVLLEGGQQRLAQNILVVSIKLQSKTKTLSLHLPDIQTEAAAAAASGASRGNTTSWNSVLQAAASGAALAPSNQLMQVSLFIPQLYVSLQNELKKDMLWMSVIEISAEYGKFLNEQQYLYASMHDMEVDTMLPDPEYPVLFGVNRRRLYGANPHLFETLVEWSSRDGRTFVDYAGVRLLPFILQVDGQVIDKMVEIATYLNPQTQQEMAEQQFQDSNYKQRQKSKKLLSEFSAFDRGQNPVGAMSSVADSSLYVDKVDVYPLDMTFSLGTNSHRWPVISEARLQLESFNRVQLLDTPAGLISLVSSSYIAQGKAEFYKILGNLDVIASPFANAKKFGRGLRDFFRMPFDALVLDDTPGAFVAGTLEGILSLLLNTTDVTFTILMRTTASLSWIMQVMTLDDKYAATKAAAIRQHPSNVVYGLGHGVRELARGLWLALSDVAVLPYEGAKQEGVLGFVKGVAKGIIGVPLKPVAGVFDFVAKSCEGLLHTLGRGYLINRRMHNYPLEKLAIDFHRAEIEQWIESRGQQVSFMDSGRYIERGRPTERYFVLTPHALYIFNPTRLQESEYAPKSISLHLIGEVLVPVSPETQFIVNLHPQHWIYDRQSFRFLVPDRKQFINRLRNVPGIKIKEISKTKLE